ncbi:hypothetical protein [Halosegnis marinus]|uniref:Uncharacterized protein n=1 Tax=Halosegnis marinus TaxID=3034023 RepID=A0ABD5ZLY1_9EURY|nr:hypothetical protein [Halosegnis sp. DT85]
MAERLDLAHDLPDDLADALGDDLRTVGTLYNDMQDLSEAAFAERFAGAHGTVTDVLDTDAEFVVAVLGLAVDPDPEGPLVAGADVVVVHEPNDDGSVRELLYTADADAATDTFVMLPLRPGDCPPGSGRSATELTLAEFREIVGAMTYKRFDLLQNDTDAYRDSYLRPAVRGLEAYAERR